MKFYSYQIKDVFRLIISGLFVFLTLAALGTFTELVRFPVWLLKICVWFGLLLLAMVLSFYSQRRKEIERLKEIPTKELINETFFYSSEYFKFIGENDPAVVAFRKIIKSKDLIKLKTNWDKLSKRFVALEKKVNRKERLFLDDYYYDYELKFKALDMRMKEKRRF